MEVTSTKPVGIPTVKKILEARVKDEQLGYEQQQTLEHAQAFAKLEEKEAHKRVEALRKAVPPLTESAAIKIADILPANPDTLRAILLQDKIELTEEEFAHVVESLSKAK